MGVVCRQVVHGKRIDCPLPGKVTNYIKQSAYLVNSSRKCRLEKKIGDYFHLIEFNTLWTKSIEKKSNTSNSNTVYSILWIH